MHTNRISPARKIIVWLASLAGLALLTSCESVTLTNLSPAALPENPSQIYTFSLRVTPRTNTITKASIDPHIILDGQNFEMKKSPIGDGIYDFEYKLAPGRDTISYYFLVTYSAEGSGNGSATRGEAYTEVSHAQIVRRYVLSMGGVNRGPVGARVGILGRGFTPDDQINFDGQPARTTYESPNSLSFYVPGLEANRNYQVTLNSPAGNSPVGTFRIDPSEVTVSPQSLTLRSNQEQMLTFTIPIPAPPGGTLLDISTDVPESVIMPEVIVEQGRKDVSIPVKGGKPGSGSLFLKGYGATELTIPVSVVK